MKNQIDIFKDFTSEERMTREGGEKFRHLILSSWQKHKKPIVVDFKNKMIASVSFWDEGVAKLILEGWSEGALRERIKLENLYHRDQEILDKLIKNRVG